MTRTIVRLLPADEQALLKAYIEGSSEPADAAAIYDTLEISAGATPPRLAIAVAHCPSPPSNFQILKNKNRSTVKFFKF